MHRVNDLTSEELSLFVSYFCKIKIWRKKKSYAYQWFDLLSSSSSENKKPEKKKSQSHLLSFVWCRSKQVSLCYPDVC